MEIHQAFPERANIVFVKVLDRANIELRIWERGAGETSASGTCASGAAVLSAFTGRTDKAVSVLTEGGFELLAGFLRLSGLTLPTVIPDIASERREPKTDKRLPEAPVTF